MTQYKSFIIHLKRATNRKAQVQHLVDHSPFDTEIIEAVDGKNLNTEAIKTFYSGKSYLDPKYPFGLNAGEVACFQSHRLAWQKIVDQNLTAGLVFEDDVQIDPDVFSNSMDAAKSWSKDFGYIQFQVRPVSQKHKVIRYYKNVRLLRPVPVILRCSAQLIAQHTARHLLKLSETFDRPVDTWLQLFWITGVMPVCVAPSGVTDRTYETGGSNLSIKRPLSSKILIEGQRWLYRSKLRRYSRTYSNLKPSEKNT